MGNEVKEIYEWISLFKLCIFKDNCIQVDDIQIKLFDIADSTNYDKLPQLSQDIRTIMVFSDEWNNKKDKCKNYILSIMGAYRDRTYARKCEIKEISKIQGKEFFDLYHIQSSNRLGIVFFGLFFQEELIGVMSLGIHNRKLKDNIIVLDRLCFKHGTQVIGGASKMFKQCVIWAKEHGYDSIISFSDNRWSQGNVYNKMNFILDRKYKPDYCYVNIANPANRISKQSQKKQVTHCPKHLTEKEWCLERGLIRIWDCGKIRWVYPLKDVKYETYSERLSRKAAEQHSNGVFKHSHMRGYFKSNKNNSEIYWGSSYELRCIYLLENDDSVRSYKRCDAIYVEEDRRWRNPDLLVEFMNSKIQIIEIKPKALVERCALQIKNSEDYANKHQYLFKVWTEKDSGLENEKEIIKWAKEYISTKYNNPKYIETAKQNSRRSTKKHYHEKIKKNKVVFYCEYCKIEHTLLKLSYDLNMKKNGRVICHNENAHKPKPKVKNINPYLSEGKKQCPSCPELGPKPFIDFSPDKSKTDGYCTKCKTCRAKEAKERSNRK